MDILKEYDCYRKAKQNIATISDVYVVILSWLFGITFVSLLDKDVEVLILCYK